MAARPFEANYASLPASESRLRRLRGVAPSDRQVQRTRFVVLSGLGLSAMSIVLVIGLALPHVLLLPGAEP